MSETLQSALMPAVTLVVAMVVFAGLRACQTAFVLLRNGVVSWQGRKVLLELKSEVDQGRRTNFELFLQHGVHHLQLHDATRARAFFEAATAAHPMSPHGYYGQGLAHRESPYFSGRLQESLLLEALDRDGRHDDARLLLVEFYAQTGQYERARNLVAELPAERYSISLDGLLERDDVPDLGETPRSWYRLTRGQKIFLGCLDIVLVALSVAAIFKPVFLPPAIYLLILLIPQHLLWFWELQADGEGFSLRSIAAQRSFRWSDLLDLVETPEGGFFLQMRDRSLFVSRHWNESADLLTRIKRHLYERGWVPALKQYQRSRWARPMLT